MKRKGFISIMALFLLTIVFLCCTGSTYLVILQTQISNNSRKNIQSRLMADDRVNKLIYDKNKIEEIIFPEIYYILRNSNPPFKNSDLNGDGEPDGKTISISNNETLGINIKSINLRLEGSEKMLKMESVPKNFDETTKLIMKFESEHDGISKTIKVIGKVINELFEIKEPYISRTKMVNNNLEDEFDNLMNIFEEQIFNHDSKNITPDFKINLKNSAEINGKYVTENHRGTNIDYEYKARRVSINLKSLGDEKPILKIIDNNNINAEIFVRGNIYCEGDIIISSPFKLEGNLILNGGSLTVLSQSKPIIQGKIFYNGDEDLNLNKISLLSEKKYIYRFGSYLPGFIDFKIDVIKK